MQKLDRYDMRILTALGANARQSVSDLARAVSLGRDLVAYRLDRLVSGGLVSGFHAVIDPYRLGLSNYKTYLKLRGTPGKVNQLYLTLRAHPQVYWAALTDGSWDLFFCCIASSPLEFTRIQQQLLEPFHHQILEREFAINTSFTMYNRGYLSGTGGIICAVGDEYQSIELSKEEETLLQALSKDARLDAVALSERCNISAATVRARIEAFEAQGVIAGYTTALNIEKFDRTLFKARLYLQSLPNKTMRTLEGLCQGASDITYLVRQLGSCPIELTIEARDYEHYHEQLAKVQEKVGSPLQRVETLLMRQSFFKWGLR